jgi:hypothetical protein
MQYFWVELNQLYPKETASVVSLILLLLTPLFEDVTSTVQVYSCMNNPWLSDISYSDAVLEHAIARRNRHLALQKTKENKG